MAQHEVNEALGGLKQTTVVEQTIADLAPSIAAFSSDTVILKAIASFPSKTSKLAVST